jgi:hypothetical protein
MQTLVDYALVALFFGSFLLPIIIPLVAGAVLGWAFRSGTEYVVNEIAEQVTEKLLTERLAADLAESLTH